MKPKTMIPLVLGVVVGGVAIKIVVDVVNSAQGATQTDMAQCVVAKMDIGFAERVTPDKLMLTEWPQGSLPAEYFSSIESLEERVTSLYIPKDVPIYPSMLAPPGTPPGLQTRIQPGYRAVSVAIDEISGVAYQVQPGDRVDVLSLVTHTVPGRGVEKLSKIILQNVEIAAVGRTINTSKDEKSRVQSLARSVTLLLKPEEVTMLHLAETSGGRISLALRSTNDEVQEKVAATTTSQLLGQEDEPFEQPTQKIAMVQEAPTWNVMVISGNKIEQVEYIWEQGQWHPKGASNGFSPTAPRGIHGLQIDQENFEDTQPDYGEEG